MTLALLNHLFDIKDFKEIYLVLVGMLAGFISLFIHELGHAWVGRIFSAQTTIHMQAWGGLTTFDRKLTRVQNFVVTLAGPLIQFIAGGLMSTNFAKSIPFSSLGQHFREQFVIVSIFWALINLIPTLPLDGGQLLHSVLGKSKIRITLGISLLVSASCTIAALYFGQFFAVIIFGYFTYQAFDQLRIRHSK